MPIYRYMWMMILPLIAATNCFGWQDPALGAGGRGHHASIENRPQYHSRGFRETNLDNTNHHGSKFGAPAQSGHGKPALSDGNHRTMDQIRGLQNSGEASHEISGQEKFKPLVEQGNPFYDGGSGNEALKNLLNWVFKAPEGVLNRVYNIVDEKVFPNAPATSGSQNGPSYESPPSSEPEPNIEGFSGGGISPFMPGDRSLNYNDSNN